MASCEARESTAKNFFTKNDAMTERITTKSTRRLRRCIDNFVIIWLDTNIDGLDPDYRNSITNLRRIVNSINTFSDADTCVDFLTEIKDEKVFMIVSDDLAQQLIPLIEQIEQLDSIYILADQKVEHDRLANELSKVKGVFTQIEPICDSLKRDNNQYEKDFISISILSSADVSNPDLDQLDQSFMYSQLLKDIILDLELDEDNMKKHLAEFYRIQYADNDSSIKLIDKFERDYHLHSPIWWYTKESFIYEMLNRALRTLDIQIILNMGFFMRNLHRQIERLHTESRNNQGPMTIYRGQSMSSRQFEMIVNSKGGLLSFNNFLSTSIDRDVSLVFAECDKHDPNLVGILFQMEVKPELASTPFVSLDKISNYDHEKEILFSMHSVFRIGEIKQIEDRLWQVELTLTESNDEQLEHLTEYIRQEIGGWPGWYRLGNLLARIGEFDYAEEVYNTLLNSTSDNDRKAHAHICHQLGSIKSDKGDYSSALALYQKALEIQRQSFPPNHPSLVSTYSNMGIAYQSIGDYSNAMSFHEKALEIQEKLHPPNFKSLATTYSNIGTVHNSMGDYSKAISFYQKTLEIQEKYLPANHPNLALTYNNIGIFHDSMGEYFKAISSYQKALLIQEKSLPPNHPDLAITYSNINFVRHSMGDDSNALSFFQKTLEIQEKSLPPDHPSLAITYGNIGRVYSSLGDYSNAMSSYEKTYEIQRKSLPPNHPSLAITYGNIGHAYQQRGDCSRALSFYEKALKIQEKYLPPNHPDLANTYSNVGTTHKSMGDYDKALFFFQKTFDIQKEALDCNHPDLARTYNNIGTVHQPMGNYSTALEFYQKALLIQEKSLSKNHPDLARTYGNIGAVRQQMGDYSTALEFYKKTLEIQEKSFPPNHLDLATTYNSIGLAHYSMQDNSAALSFFQKTLEIQEKALPPDHPDLVTTRFLHRHLSDLIKQRN